MKISILDSKGKSTGREVTLPKDIYAIEPNEHALYLDVKQYLANQRQGTHKAKERADIALEVLEKSKSKKVLEQRVLVVLNLVCLEVVEEYLVQDQEIMMLS